MDAVNDTYYSYLSIGKAFERIGNAVYKVG
jgi:hypothetical protein